MPTNKKKLAETKMEPMVADTGHFKHPSTITEGNKKGSCRQGVGPIDWDNVKKRA